MPKTLEAFNKENPVHCLAKDRGKDLQWYVYACGCNHPLSSMKAPHSEDTCFYFNVFGMFNSKEEGKKWVEEYCEEWKETHDDEECPMQLWVVPVGMWMRWPNKVNHIGEYVADNLDEEVRSMLDGYRKQNEAAQKEIKKRRDREVARGEELLRKSGFKGHIPSMPAPKEKPLTGKERRQLKRRLKKAESEEEGK